MPERATNRRGSWLLLFAAGVQVALLARSAGLAVRGERRLAASFANGGPCHPDVWALRELPRAAREIPAEARVLVVALQPAPVAYELYFQPRDLRVLVALDDALVEQVGAVSAELAGGLATFRDRLESAGRRLTPERLEAELARAEYVVAFLGDLPRAPEGFERVWSGEETSVWRRRR